MSDYNLDRIRMNVVKTAAAGVVNHETIFDFRQNGNVVTSGYAGGAVVQGYLVGALQGAALTFRYCQIDKYGNLDGGVSTCRLSRLPDGRLAMTETFQWESREGVGENVFEEIIPR